jgi:cytochrome c peroxidase
MASMAIVILSIQSCQDNNDSPDTGIRFTYPLNWPQPVYQFNNNAVTNERFSLGRKLFYDKILSRDNTISCGSCHLQAGAFAHIDHRVSHGIDNLEGVRNSPSLFNLAWHTNFFWDGGVNHLELQPIGPIQNPVEMDETLGNVIQKLNASAHYRGLFLQAYGSDSITSQMMLRALAQFMAVMVSSESPYDDYVKGNEQVLSQSQVRGLALFRQNCESCHKEPLFTDLTYRNNGLDATFADSGRALITLSPMDMGKFKVPSLRNVEVSYPYMHDGSVLTLEDAIEHYASGIVPSPTLDPLLSGGFPLSPQDKSDLVNFLKSLTDEKFLNNPDYSEPE